MAGLTPARTMLPGPLSATEPVGGVFRAREIGRAGALLVGTAGLAGLVAALIVVVHPSEDSAPGYHPLAVAVVCAAAVVAMVVLLIRHQVLPTAGTAVFITLSMVGVTVTAYAAGGRAASFATLFYVWSGTAFVFLAKRAAMAQVALTGVLHAVLLAVQPGHYQVVGEWVFTFGVTVLTALVVSHIVTALLTLARAEAGARAEAEKGKAEVERLSRQKSEFLARTSYEVRTPLNAIIGFSDMLGDGLVGSLNPRQAEYVDEVRTSGRHLLALINEVLDIPRVEAGRQDLDLSQFSLDGVITGAIALFGPEAERKGVTIGRWPVRGEPAGTVRGDERKVRQVVLNLLSNAIKFTPVGGRVTVKAIARGRFVDISVADTGPGIAVEDVDRIFEEYRQAPGGIAQDVGTGLGLPLARGFAEAHGGSLGVETAPGRGSTFTLRLPRDGPQVATGRADRADTARAETFGDWYRSRPLDTPELRVKMASAPAVIAVGAAVLGAFVIALEAIHPARPRLTDFHPLALGGLVALSLAVGFLSLRHGVNTRRMAVMLVIGTLGFTAAGFAVGARYQAYGSMFYVWVGIGAVTFVGRRAAIVLVSMVGVCYALLLAVQDGNANPLARWVIVMTVVAVSAAGIDWLLVRVAAMASAEHQARIAVEHVRGEIQESSRHKSEFVATMSHELRTPLNAIIGFSEVLADELFGPLTDRQRDYAQELTQAGHQLLALVNDILDLAKIDAGRMDLELADGVDASEIIRSVCDEVPGAGTARVEHDTPTVRADERKLRRMVANLVTEMADAGRVLVVAGSGRASRRGWLVVDVQAGFAADGGVVAEPLLEGPSDPGPEEPVLGTAPLRVAVAAALAGMHGGSVEEICDQGGWRLSLPPQPLPASPESAPEWA